jgi:sugar O-acyltransferase (sialic acid O-acetyltransferase NeuD family)
MAEVVVIGGGGHARVMWQALRGLGHHVIGYTAPAQSQRDLPIPWLGTDDDLLARAFETQFAGVLGIGKTDAGGHRLAILERLADGGIELPTIVASGAIVHEDVTMDAGTVILSGAVVVIGTRMGRACIVNTHASVDHDCVLGDDVHVAPGAVLCGEVHIGTSSFIGAGATVVPGVQICSGCVIAAGATVTRPIHEPGVYAGTPTRRIR